MLFFGRQFNFPVALEGALKMKEITYLFAEGHPSAELKHGIIALVRPELPSVFIAPDDAVFSKNLNNIEQVRARKGPVIAVTSGNGAKQLEKIADDIITLPARPRLRQPDPDRHPAATARLPPRRRARPRRGQAAQSRQERDGRVAGNASAIPGVAASRSLTHCRAINSLAVLVQRPPVQAKEDYVLKLLEDAGLVTARKSRRPNQAERRDQRRRCPDQGRRCFRGDVSRSLAAQAHMDWVDLSTKIIPPEVINQIRAEDARRFKVIPVGFGETGLIVAVGDPLDIDTIDSLSFLLQREIELVCASPEKIRRP